MASKQTDVNTADGLVILLDKLTRWGRRTYTAAWAMFPLEVVHQRPIAQQEFLILYMRLHRLEKPAPFNRVNAQSLCKKWCSPEWPQVKRRYISNHWDDYVDISVSRSLPRGHADLISFCVTRHGDWQCAKVKIFITGRFNWEDLFDSEAKIATAILASLSNKT